MKIQFAAANANNNELEQNPTVDSALDRLNSKDTFLLPFYMGSEDYNIFTYYVNKIQTTSHLALIWSIEFQNIW